MTEEIIVEKKKGLMTNTLRQLEDLGIQLLGVFKIGEMNLNLTNDQLIKLVNFNAEKDVLSWDSTTETTMDMAGRFL